MRATGSRGRIHLAHRRAGSRAYKRYLDEMHGMPLQIDLDGHSARSTHRPRERLGYPTQKPIALARTHHLRVLSARRPRSRLLHRLGTTAEAAERLGRRWIGIDNGKYAIHLARKRLIQLHGQPRPPEKAAVRLRRVRHCKNIERKEKPQRSPGPFNVRPFTVENMGVYQRAEQWQDFQTQRSRLPRRDDQGLRRRARRALAAPPRPQGQHLGPRRPARRPVSVGAGLEHRARGAAHRHQGRHHALGRLRHALGQREGRRSRRRPASPSRSASSRRSAIDEVRRRIELLSAPTRRADRVDGDPGVLRAALDRARRASVSGRTVELTLERCEVDIESFIASQRPMLKPITDGMTRGRAQEGRGRAASKWDGAREGAARSGSRKADDLAEVRRLLGRRLGLRPPRRRRTTSPSSRPTGRASACARRKGEIEPLVFTAEFKYAEPGHYRIAARVTDVFGNDGIATVAGRGEVMA